MNKNLIIFGVAVLIICVGLSGCNEQKDAKTVLIDGCEWSTIIEFDNSYIDCILKIYMFFEDDFYRCESTYFMADESLKYYKSSGTYHMGNNKIYLDEEKSQTSDNKYLDGWSDIDCKSFDYSFEIIDSNTVKIGAYEYHCSIN